MTLKQEYMQAIKQGKFQGSYKEWLAYTNDKLTKTLKVLNKMGL